MSQNNPYGGPPQDPYGQPGGYGAGGPAPQGWPQGQQPGYPTSSSTPPPPPPGQGYGFGPFAPGPGQGPYGPGQPNPGQYPPQPNQPGGPPGPPPAKGKSKIGLIIGAGVLVLLLGVIGAVALANRGEPQAGPGPTTSQGPSDPTTAPPVAATNASDAVNGYLQAVAAGDVATALAYGSTPVDDDSLLSAKVVGAARKRAPISNIQVPTVDNKNATAVPATYMVGTTQVSENFAVEKVGDNWKLAKVASEIDLTLVRAGGLPVVVNGQKVSSTTVYALPGAYVFTTGRKYVTFGSKNVVSVKGPNRETTLYTLRPTVTSGGKKAAVAQAKKIYTKCLKSSSAKPSKCPNRWTSSTVKWRNGTIDWKQKGKDPFKSVKVNTYGSLLRIEIPIRLELSGTCTQQGRTGRCVGATLTGNAYARTTSLYSDKFSVKWVY